MNDKPVDSPLDGRRPRVADVAARAGVSMATVDRVLNGRGGVRGQTVARVEQAIREMSEFRGPLAAAARQMNRIDIILAGDGSAVTRLLAERLGRECHAAGVETHTAFVERMNPAVLAATLIDCAARESSGVFVQAYDHVLVREAISRLAATGIPVVTVLTDVAGLDRVAYVGLDNRAAGRTAGFLMGRFCRRSGKLAIVWGGQLYRSHEERESGFRGALRTERPDLVCLEVIADNDDPAEARTQALAMLRTNDELCGIYCIGGGITGVAEALVETGLDQRIVMIGHNFNDQTKPYLLSGTIDALIHQDTERIAAAAMRAVLREPELPPDNLIPIAIVTRENMFDY